MTERRDPWFGLNHDVMDRALKNAQRRVAEKARDACMEVAASYDVDDPRNQGADACTGRIARTVLQDLEKKEGTPFEGAWSVDVIEVENVGFRTEFKVGVQCFRLADVRLDEHTSAEEARGHCELIQRTFVKALLALGVSPTQEIGHVPDPHAAVQKLLFAMKIYPGYSVESRGPSGCIIDAIAELEPDTAKKIQDGDDLEDLLEDVD